MIVYYSDVTHKKSNKFYPHKIEVKTIEDLKKAVSFDYTGCEFKEFTRGNENFLSTDCLLLDIDNDDSDAPEDWVTIEMVKEYFSNVEMYIHYSTHHLIEKNGKAARPKFHLLFPIGKIEDGLTFQQLKKKVSNYFPFFDGNAMDNGRFFFGTKPPQVDYIKGSITLDKFIAWADSDSNPNLEIGEGHRNGYLCSFGARVVKKIGYVDEAYKAILDRNEEVCKPPLEEDEIKNTIWKSLESFNKKLLKTPGYIPPDKYKELDWESKLIRNDKTKAISNCTNNLILILENDHLLRNIVYNELANDIEIVGEIAWPVKSRFWRDADDAQLICYINDKYGNFTKENYVNAVTKVVDDRSYHPIKQYLESLPEWDGTSRVETFLIDYFGAEDTPYSRAIIKKILVAAYMRIYHPGIKFDYIMVLNGPQGVGKSTAIAKLGMDWYSDSLSVSDMNDKTAAEKLQGYWILEIGELAGMKKADIDKVKAFISRQDDKYRASFGRRVNSHPRQCIFFATTNEQNGYLRDNTGNRRFWPIKTPGTGTKKAWELASDEVKQIWAEVKVLAEKGESLFIDDKLIAEAAEEAAQEAMQHDEREGLVREYLDTLLPENWYELDVGERISFLGDKKHELHKEGTMRRTFVTNIEIWTECFGNRKEAFTGNDVGPIATIMNKMKGWTRTDERKSVPGYGRQRIYKVTK
jgi:predicted P-loop ATPase